MQVCVWGSVCMCMYICLCVYINLWYIWKQVYMNMCMSMYMCVCTHVLAYTCKLRNVTCYVLWRSPERADSWFFLHLALLFFSLWLHLALCQMASLLVKFCFNISVFLELCTKQRAYSSLWKLSSVESSALWGKQRDEPWEGDFLGEPNWNSHLVSIRSQSGSSWVY